MIGRNPDALTASSTEEIWRIIIKIPSFMKEVLWLGVQQSEVSQIKWCQIYIHLPITSRCYNPNFMYGLEEDMRWTPADL